MESCFSRRDTVMESCFSRRDTVMENCFSRRDTVMESCFSRRDTVMESCFSRRDTVMESCFSRRDTVMESCFSRRDTVMESCFSRRDTVMESCFRRHQMNLQQHNFTWALSEFGRAQTGFVCDAGGSVETRRRYYRGKYENLLSLAQTYKALKLRQCILPFVDSIYILKVDVSIVKADRLKLTGLLAEAVNVEMHVWSRVEQTLFQFIKQKPFHFLNPKNQPIYLHYILFQTLSYVLSKLKQAHHLPSCAYIIVID